MTPEDPPAEVGAFHPQPASDPHPPSGVEFPIYLDHAATTPLDPQVLEAMRPYLTEEFGNPNSLHRPGRRARRAVETARRTVASLLNAHRGQIVFTGGGTEADNLAILGAAWAGRARGKRRGQKGHIHIITTRVEHHAVLHACRHLERQGFAVTYLPVDAQGLVDPDEVRSALRPETVLVSVMAANNEVGTIQPLAEIGRLLRDHPARFHTDAVQAAGHIPLDVEALGVDLLSLSAHKFYGPKGTGALFIRSGTEVEPLIHGGGQEDGYRSGTENVAGIVGLAAALERACAGMAEEAERLTRLRDTLIRGVLEKIEGARLTGHPTRRLPGSASFCFEGAYGESLVLKLDMEGICASTGSACTSGEVDPSHVLLAMGIPRELANGSLRLTLGRGTTEAQVRHVLSALPEAVAQVRRLHPSVR